MKVGIIGQGFVGTAVKEGLKDYYSVETFDLVKPCTCSSLHELVNTTDV